MNVLVPQISQSKHSFSSLLIVFPVYSDHSRVFMGYITSLTITILSSFNANIRSGRPRSVGKWQPLLLPIQLHWHTAPHSQLFQLHFQLLHTSIHLSTYTFVTVKHVHAQYRLPSLVTLSLLPLLSLSTSYSTKPTYVHSSKYHYIPMYM